MFARAYTRAVGAAGVWSSMCVSAALAHIYLWHVALADLSAWQVDPGVTLVALNHGSARKRFHAETCHQVPRIVIWEDEIHRTHRIRFGHNVKLVTLQHLHQYVTSPESTMMSSSSPEPSSSLNTTCFPCRNTVLFPEKPSTFCTFTTPSSRSRPSQYRRSCLGSSLQGGGVGRRSGWRGMLISSSGSSLIMRSPKEIG